MVCDETFLGQLTAFFVVTYPGGAPTIWDIENFSMYLLISMRTNRAFCIVKRYAGRILLTGLANAGRPRNTNEPIGFLGSFNPTRPLNGAGEFL